MFGISSRIHTFPDELHPIVHVMPVYVPIQLTVAKGFKYGDLEDFNTWTAALKEIAMGFQKSIELVKSKTCVVSFRKESVITDHCTG